MELGKTKIWKLLGFLPEKISVAGCWTRSLSRRAPCPLLKIVLVANRTKICGCFLFFYFWKIFPQQQNFAMGSLAQISSGAIRCSCNTRFRTRFRRFWCWYFVRFRKLGSRGFWYKYLVRFLKFPVQLPDEVPEGLGEDMWWGSIGFRARYLVRFRRVPVQIPCEILEGSGADAFWKSKGFRCFFMA